MGRRLSRGDGSQRSDAPLAPIMDLVPFGLVVATPDGSARQANRTWCSMSEQPDGSWRDAGWFAVLPVEQRDQARHALVEDIGAGRTHDVDWVAPRSASGGPRVLRIEATPQRTDGEVTGMVVVATDVTTQRERVHDLVVRATRDPLTGLYNRAQFLDFVRHALDRQRRDPSHRSTIFFVDVDDLATTNDERGHLAGDGRLRDVAAGILSALRPSDVVARFEGGQFTVLGESLGDPAEAALIADRIRASVAMSGLGARVSVGFAIADHPELDPVALVGIAQRTMHQTRRSHEPPMPSTAEVRPEPSRRSFESVRDVLAVAAHEIKTPLTSIVGYAATLRANRHRMSDDAAEAAFDALERQTARLATMVDHLLQLGRLGHPSQVADVLVDLDAVIAEALEIAPPEEPVTVLVMVASDASGPLVWADPTALLRAVVNLLTNAYAHGGPHITVEVSIADRRADLVVEDDGHGVPDELVPMLFEPFARGPRGASRAEGAGLGLAIAHEIATSLGGTLGHEAVVPHGARLRLSLPLPS